MKHPTKRRVSVSKDRASELFIGGLCGCLSLADQLGLSASTGGALMSALSMALPKLSFSGIIRAHRKLGGELSPEVEAKLLAATAKLKRKAQQ